MHQETEREKAWRECAEWAAALLSCAEAACSKTLSDTHQSEWRQGHKKWWVDYVETQSKFGQHTLLDGEFHPDNPTFTK